MDATLTGSYPATKTLQTPTLRRVCAWTTQLFRVFDNVKTLRETGQFVGELDKALEPYANLNDEGLAALLPMLQEVVRYGPDSRRRVRLSSRLGRGFTCTRRERSQKSSYAVLKLCVAACVVFKVVLAGGRSNWF
jgi:hypothetical protein